MVRNRNLASDMVNTALESWLAHLRLQSRRDFLMHRLDIETAERVVRHYLTINYVGSW